MICLFKTLEKKWIVKSEKEENDLNFLRIIRNNGKEICGRKKKKKRWIAYPKHEREWTKK